MLGKRLGQALLVFILITLTSVAAAQSRSPSAGVIENLSTQQGKQASQPRASTVAPVIPQGATSQEYVLGVGDEIRLTVYGEEDLSGQYLVGSTGIVSLPLIGNIEAANRTIYEVEEDLTKKLSSGYLNDPRVNIEVVNYRPFFILGEVTKPGSYAYVNGMTVLNAVALAGGYTYRADSDDITIVRADDPKKKEVNIKESAVVMPGDIVRVPERFF